ncbi:hypothetical protein [Alkalimarinus sediminis]|uniref:Transmembrane protein n=1 Tax=Alkalimarinus sediminis TaxID=1632866 RepID=A0A9E8KQM5_9ALTE|nr:hypothetical protein [Alkalimarinus sediminis]UZW75335.1 hypothetical protein NNL22_01630 [Alkalimarinus sediminis]
MKEAVAECPDTSITDALSQWWQSLAYRNRAAEWSLYFMFVTGILLWNQISIPWQVERLLLLVHVVSSLLLFPVAVVPFWLSHRKLLVRSKKKLLKVTGQLIDYILLGCMASGIYLVLQGNRGDDFGWVVYMVHLVTALVLIPLLIRHAAKWSVLKPLWSWCLSKSNGSYS